MTEEGALTLRRAARADTPAIAAGLAKPGVDEAAVAGWLLERGLLLAERTGRVLGVAGWQVENLVAVVDLLQVAGDDLWPAVGVPLLQAVEAAAHDLMCEVAVLALAEPLPAQAMQELRGLGYAELGWTSLHRYWREVVASFGVPEGSVWAHRLRERMVLRPI